MTVKTVYIIAFLVLLIHGIGHIQGVVSGFGVKFNRNASVTSWLLKDLGSKLNTWICLLLYSGSAIFGILAALSFKGILFSIQFCLRITGLLTFSRIYYITLIPGIVKYLLYHKRINSNLHYLFQPSSPQLQFHSEL